MTCKRLWRRRTGPPALHPAPLPYRSVSVSCRALQRFEARQMEEMNAAMARLGQSVSDRDINRLTLRHVEQREVGPRREGEGCVGVGAGWLA